MSKRMNTMVLKEMNRRKVVEALLSSEGATILEISQQTELSTVTVGTIINECIQSGEVFEASVSPSQGGRPARTFRINPDFMHGLIVFGNIHKGEDKIFYRVINRCGEIVKEWMGNEETITIEHIEKEVMDAIESDAAIKGIGFGLPGVEYQERMHINDYEGLKGISISRYFTERLEIPVLIDNDVNLAAVGYNEIQRERRRHLVYIYFPGKYPPGAGVLIHGVLYKGRDGYVGEMNGLYSGLDWETFREGSNELKVRLLKPIIQSLSVWINPDTLILTGDGITEELLSHLQLDMETWESKEFLPQVDISMDFDLDFELGLLRTLGRRMEEERWAF